MINGKFVVFIHGFFYAASEPTGTAGSLLKMETKSKFKF